MISRANDGHISYLGILGMVHQSRTSVRVKYLCWHYRAGCL